MLIATYFFLVNEVFPRCAVILGTIIGAAMPCVVMLAGITMLFGAVGVPISKNLGSTVVGGIFRAIGFCTKQLFSAIRWVVLRIATLLPRVFTGSRKFFKAKGFGSGLSTLLASVITLVVLLVII